MTFERTRKLRQRLDQEGAFIAVGCDDALTVRMIEQVHFPVAYISGAFVMEI